MRYFASLMISVLLASGAAAQDARQQPKKDKETKESKEPAPAKPETAAGAKAGVTAETAQSPLDFTMKDIDGKDVALSKYKGKVVLIVNVASKCGLTPQYEQLQQLHDKYKDKGLAILAFPANNFMGQEPGTNAEIKEFCQTKFKVGFDLFSKVSVKGDDACELYKYLTTRSPDTRKRGDIEWNFAKFLVDRDGNLVNRFHPKVKPDDAELVKAVEEALAAKKP
jgi:glutathione peroxidase